MAVFKCKMCGGTLEVKAGESVIECSYCGNMNTLPKLDDDRRVSLYDRANHYMQNNEYDKAMSTYEKILEEDKTDAEAYWSIVLCRYGIEYVEDPTSHKRIPTINRMQMTSILADQDYKSALKYADSYQKSVYEQQAKDIADIQKGILEIVNNEEPFDIFICYKETDNNGRRTQDSVLAQELYYGLKNEGFKVFFSRITLEDKLGVAYEPYIFSALQSSKVMVVIGTKPEHFNAVWVKNEWNRYLSLIRNGEKKTIIPAYKDMDPYDIPDELSHLQAQDMSKLGFLQDMIRGIKKVVQTEPEVKVVKEVRTETAGGNANVKNLLNRVKIFLADDEFDKAREYCNRILDMDAENSDAYLYLAMCDQKVSEEDDLSNVTYDIERNGNFYKATKYANDDQRQKLEQYIQQNLEYRQQILDKKKKKTKKIKLSAIIAAAMLVIITLICVMSIFVNMEICGVSMDFWDRSRVYGITKANPDGSWTIPSKVYGTTVKYIYIREGSVCEASKIIIPSTVEDIYITNPKIKEVVLADDWTSIGSHAFSGCSSLTSITIPNSVTFIGYNAFCGCSSRLTSIVVQEGNIKYHSNGNCLIETESKTLILGCSTSVIPTDGSVTSIGYGAFEGCSSLTSITIPDSVTSIGYGAFDDCSSLTIINYQGTKSQWYAIDKGAYWDIHTGAYTIYCTNGTISK